LTKEFTQTITFRLCKALANKELATGNGFLFRFVMQIFHFITFFLKNTKEPFTLQGYFL